MIFWVERRYAEDTLELGNQMTDELRQYWHAAADDAACDFRIAEKKLAGDLTMIEKEVTDDQSETDTSEYVMFLSRVNLKEAIVRRILATHVLSKFSD